MHRKRPDEHDHDASMLPIIAWSRNFRLEKLDGGFQMSWKDREVDKFQVKRNENPKSYCPIVFCTPAINYGLSKEDFEKVKQRVLEFDIDGD